jgi:hypothetical protein
MSQTTDSPEQLVSQLQTQQHLHPYRSLEVALQHLEQLIGLCPNVAEQAISALSLDRDVKIGRLRRCQLLQLARTLHRLWRQNRPSVSHPFQPA